MMMMRGASTGMATPTQLNGRSQTNAGGNFSVSLTEQLAFQLIQQAKARTFNSIPHLRFSLSQYKGVLADVEPLRGFAGWLRVSKLRLATPALTREHLVLSVCPDDNSHDAHPETLERLMAVPADNLGEVSGAPVPELTEIEAARRQVLLELAEQENADWLDEENEKLDSYADDREKAFELEVKNLDAEIKQAKKALRGSSLQMAEKLAEKRRISSQEGKRDKMKAEFFDRRAQIRAEVESMLDRIQESLKMEPTLTPLFTIRWEVAS
jgi:hypothetical protein